MPPIMPCLWFDTQALEAAKFYTAIFPRSKILEITRYSEAGPGAAGSVMTVRFKLDGADFVALNGGPTYPFTPAISLSVSCKTDIAKIEKAAAAATPARAPARKRRR